EGLSNAARHARASHVAVNVRMEGEQVVVEVIDDGVGLPAGNQRRSGLDNMGERARRHGGSSQARPNQEGGTTLRWTAELNS
ncbi:MAG TPA: ATP-binding protein, partial [Kineosporiaceae bacterium]